MNTCRGLSNLSVSATSDNAVRLHSLAILWYDWHRILLRSVCAAKVA